MRRKLAFGVGAVALCAAGFSALAPAHKDGTPGYEYSGIPPGNLAEERAAIERFCPAEPPCHVVEAGADSEAAGGGSRVGEDLHALGRPAEACPAAAAVYEEAGDRVDAWIGPCPSAQAAERIAAHAPPPPPDPEAEAARAMASEEVK